MARTVLTDSQRENMLAMRDAKFTNLQIADIFSCSPSAVSTLFSIYDAVREGRPVNPNYAQSQPAHVRFVQNKLGISQREEKAPEKDNTALAMVTLLEAIKELTASVNAIDNRLSAMQMTMSGFRGDAAEQSKKLVETINVNGDIQTKEWQAIREKLDAIKTNTKRICKGDA